MLKILLVTNLYPNRYEPTRGIFTKQIVDGLKKSHQVQVVAPTPWIPNIFRKLKKSSIEKLNYETEYDGIKVYHPEYLVIPKIGRWLYGFLFFLGIFRTIKRIKKEFNPDVINVHWMYPDAFGTVLCAKLLGIPVVTHSLGCDINEYAKYPSRRFFISQALKHSNHNIAVSEELRQKSIQLGANPNKTTTIMNGVNQELFGHQDKKQLREKLHLPQDKTLLLFAGNFNVEKGLAVLIQAFNKISTNHPQTLLVVVGSGPLEQEIFSLVAQLGLEEKIIFKGRVAHDAVPNYLSAVDFLCLPSLREGCPNIVLEALSSGTPVLSSRVGAVPEMLASSNDRLGDMAAPGDVDDLARLLHESLTSKWNTPVSFSWMNWQESADKIAETLNQTVLNLQQSMNK